ncbi:unnamed protein product, partial [Ixodes pacificus]
MNFGTASAYLSGLQTLHSVFSLSIMTRTKPDHFLHMHLSQLQGNISTAWSLWERSKCGSAARESATGGGAAGSNEWAVQPTLVPGGFTAVPAGDREAAAAGGSESPAGEGVHRKGYASCHGNDRSSNCCRGVLPSVKKITGGPKNFNWTG